MVGLTSPRQHIGGSNDVAMVIASHVNVSLGPHPAVAQASGLKTKSLIQVPIKCMLFFNGRGYGISSNSANISNSVGLP
jgi:hypothetical protein